MINSIFDKLVFRIGGLAGSFVIWLTEVVIARDPARSSSTESSSYQDTSMNNERIQELQARIADLKKRWPAHSVPPALLQELDDLEEDLATELKKAGQEDTHA